MHSLPAGLENTRKYWLRSHRSRWGATGASKWPPPEPLGLRNGCPGATGASKWLLREPLGLRNGCPGATRASEWLPPEPPRAGFINSAPKHILYLDQVVPEGSRFFSSPGTLPSHSGRRRHGALVGCARRVRSPTASASRCPRRRKLVGQRRRVRAQARSCSSYKVNGRLLAILIRNAQARHSKRFMHSMLLWRCSRPGGRISELGVAPGTNI